jgi:uncharacterized damage-inducible protein DinB
MRTLVISLLATALVASAQDKATEKPPAPTDPLSSFNKVAYGYVKMTILHTAEKMPEENYSFKPTDSVRAFGQILGHVADAQYLFCSVALGEKNPEPKIEQTKTSKADLIASLKDAFAYCDRAYNSMTDAAGNQTVNLFGQPNVPKTSVLGVNLMHTMEHYGNLTTYLRIKNIVPPTSEQAPPPAPKK